LVFDFGTTTSTSVREPSEAENLLVITIFDFSSFTLRPVKAAISVFMNLIIERKSIRVFLTDVER